MHAESADRPHRPARAFTLIELIAVIFVAAIIVGVFLPALGHSGGRCGCGSRQLKDSTQVRGILQSMVVFSQNNRNRYPLPSKIDPSGLTVAAKGQAQDTTGNILSILIFNGNISPEICISPNESNTGQVIKMDDYEFTDPKAAVDPKVAQWDPRFRGTPIDSPVGNLAADAPGNQSYAQLVLTGRRVEHWADTFSTTEAVFGNRGPQYAAADFATSPSTGRWPLLSGATGTGSNTLLIHGGRTTWEGNIAYNDGHVQFETKPNPDGVTYTRAVNGRRTPTTDNLFVDEADEIDDDGYPALYRSTQLNAYLRPIATRTATEIKPWID